MVLRKKRLVIDQFFYRRVSKKLPLQRTYIHNRKKILPPSSLFKSMDDNFIIVVYVWLFICLWICLVFCVFTINSYSKIQNENYRESKSWTSSFTVKRTLVFSFLDFVFIFGNIIWKSENRKSGKSKIWKSEKSKIENRNFISHLQNTIKSSIVNGIQHNWYLWIPS